MCVTDASVYVARLRENEPHHAACKRLLAAIQTRRTAVARPNLVWIEVAAVVQRGTGDPELARAAAELAGERGLRGADAVYVALAKRLGWALIALDEEQRRRKRAGADVLAAGIAGGLGRPGGASVTARHPGECWHCPLRTRRSRR